MIKEQILADLKAAMKEGDAFRRDTLRMIDSMIKNVEIEKKKREAGLTDEEIQEVIARAIKQRKDSMAQYESGGRADLAEKESKEVDILMTYMPAQMSEEEAQKIIKETLAGLGISSKSDMGRAMSAVMEKVKGKIDGQIVRKMVEEELK